MAKQTRTNNEIITALEAAGGNREQAAARLGITRAHLERQLTKIDASLVPPRPQKSGRPKSTHSEPLDRPKFSRETIENFRAFARAKMPARDIIKMVLRIIERQRAEIAAATEEREFAAEREQAEADLFTQYPT